MRFKIKSKKEFRVLAKHINDGTSYNIGIAEATVSETGFTDKQLEQLAALLAPIKQDIAVLKQDVSMLKQDVSSLKQDMIEVKKDIAELKKDMAEIKSLPTIQRELKQKKI